MQYLQGKFFIRNLYKNNGKISINKNYRRIQAEIKKCKYRERNNTMDANILSVGTKERPPLKY